MLARTIEKKQEEELEIVDSVAVSMLSCQSYLKRVCTRNRIEM